MSDTAGTVRQLRNGQHISVPQSQWRDLALALQPGSYGTRLQGPYVLVWLHPEFVIPPPPHGGYTRAGFFKRAVC